MSNKFTDILDSKGVKWINGGKPGEVNICCPFCHLQGETPDTKFRLGINLVSGKAHDFNCNWSSRTNTIKKVLAGLDIKADSDEGEVKQVEEQQFEGKLPVSYEPLWPVKKDRDFQKAYKYIRSRGITNRQIRKYKIGVCLGGKYSNRIIFPIFRKDKLKGFIGRDFTGKQYLRYKNSKGKKTLYGVPEKKNEAVVLVEGAIDKLSTENVLKYRHVDVIGIPGRVIRDKDIKLLKGYKKIIRVPDDNRPGLTGALKDAKKLQEEGFNVDISFLSTKYVDINQAYCAKDFQVIDDLVKNSQPFTWALEMKIKGMIAVDYRGVRKIK